MDEKILKIKIYSYDFALLDVLGKKICDLLKSSFKNMSAVFMPNKRNLITIKKSGFVYGSSVRHLHLLKRSLCIFVTCTNLNDVQKKLASVSIPHGTCVIVKKKEIKHSIEKKK